MPVSKMQGEIAIGSGWLSTVQTDVVKLGHCGVEKQRNTVKRRRCTGGILTAVLACGLLVDWHSCLLFKNAYTFPWGDSVFQCESAF